MSDNFLAIPDDVYFSGSPFVKAEFLQNQQTISEVSLPSVTVQDIDAMNVTEGTTMPNHEHTIESGQIPLTDFKGSVITTHPSQVIPEESPTKKKPNVTVHTQFKQKTKHHKLENMKPSIKESIKKTLSDPASRSHKDTAISDRNRWVYICTCACYEFGKK